MTKDYSQMTEKELRQIKNTAPSRSREASEARQELNRRAMQSDRVIGPIGRSPNPPNRRSN